MITILPGAERPDAVEAAQNGGGYTQLVATADGRVTGTEEYRVALVGHTPCHWEHPVWPDEERERFLLHLTTCDLRDGTES